MGDISEHFGRRDFSSRNNSGYFKISLTLIGYLEFIRSHFKSHVEVLKGFVTADEAEKEKSFFKKNWHTLGKAAVIRLRGVDAKEVFLFVERIKEITGLGYDPQNQCVHLDLRDREPFKYIWENGVPVPITLALRERYGLGSEGETLELRELPRMKSLFEEDGETVSA